MRRHAPRLLGSMLAAALALGSSACGPGPDADTAATGAIVYGDDDRREYFEVASGPARDRMGESVAALVPRALVAVTGGVLRTDVPTAREANELCPGEPFAEQPAAAFCSAVLVDWDLLVTAGHCARVFAPRDMVAVFGYHYAAPGQLAATRADVYDVEAIVAEALDPAGADPRRDFAWFRLARAVSAPRRPAPVRVAAALAAGAPLTSIGAGGGLPLKLDAGGRVQDARQAHGDYFTAETDTSHGSSGGGAFDDALALVGVFARGGADYTRTDEGCQATVRTPAGGTSEEQFNYLAPAVTALCASEGRTSSLCRADCGDPCEALPHVDPSGCAISGGLRHPSPLGATALALAIAAGIASRRRGRTPSPGEAGRGLG